MDITTVSIVMIVHNEWPFIDRTLRSIIDEAGEIVISDNASTDGTSEVCQLYAMAYPKIKYIRHEKDIGPVNNFWGAINQCTGKYIRPIGGHDIVSSGSTKSMLKIMEKDPENVLVYSKTTVFLNNDYSLNWCHIIMENKFTSSSPYERVYTIINTMHLAPLLYGLWKASIWKDLSKEFEKNYLIFEKIDGDWAFFLYAASRGKLIADEHSVFFWVYSRPRSPQFMKYSEQTTKIMTGYAYSNPYTYFLSIMCILYKLAEEMQMWPGAPSDFKENIFGSLGQFFGIIGVGDSSLDIPLTKDGMPPVMPGNELVFDKVFNSLLSYQQSRSSSQQSTFQTSSSKKPKLIKRILKRLFRAFKKRFYNPLKRLLKRIYDSL
jgi:glycosyltransferase involved in cell wall biosynthesis